MKYTKQQFRKKLYRYLTRKNPLKLPGQQIKSKYQSLAENCQYSIIEAMPNKKIRRYVVTVLWMPECIDDYDVFLLSTGELYHIARHKCCQKHCDTWRELMK